MIRWMFCVGLMALYTAAWFLPVFEFPPRPPGLNHMNPTPDGGTPPGYLVFTWGCLCFYGYPLLPNLAFLVGLAFLASGRDRRARSTGAVALVTGVLSYLLLHGAYARLMVGYFAWLASLSSLWLAASWLTRLGDAPRGKRKASSDAEPPS